MYCIFNLRSTSCICDYITWSYETTIVIIDSKLSEKSEVTI